MAIRSKASMGIVLAGLFLAPPWFAALARPQIASVQVGLGEELTRIIVSLDERASYEILEQDLADSLIVAFPEAQLGRDGVRVGQGWGLVRDYRIEEDENGGERVVLAFKRPARIRSVSTTQNLDAGRHALVIDLVAKTITDATVRSSSPTRVASGTTPQVQLANLPSSREVVNAESSDALQEQRLARLERLLEVQEQRLQQQQAQLNRQRAEIKALRSDDSFLASGKVPNAPAAPRRFAQAQSPPVAPRAVAPRPVPPGSADPGDGDKMPAASKQVAPRPSAGPVSPQPVAPQPAASQPVAPKPRAPTQQSPQPVAPAAPQPAPAQQQIDASGERPDAQRKPDELLLAQHGILLPPGKGQLEVGVSHSHFSSNRINIGGFTIFEAIVIGTIRVDQLDRDVVTGTTTARFGVLPRLQVEARVPYVYREDDELLAAGTNDQRNVIVNGNGIGDIEGTITYQPIVASGLLPDTLARLRVKSRSGRDSFEIETQSVGTGGQTRLVDSPTGSGFITINPGLTAVWRSDPVAFFLSGGYAYNKSRKVGAFGEIDPGDTIDFATGFNVSLSDRVSMNMSFVNQFTGKTKQNGVETDGSDTNDARVQLGASVGLTPSFSILASAGIGLTEESPDYTFGLSGSYSFDFTSLFGGSDN